MSHQFSVSPQHIHIELSHVVCFDHPCDDGLNGLSGAGVMPLEGEVGEGDEGDGPEVMSCR